MPIVNVANHFIEQDGNPVDPDKLQTTRNRKNKDNKRKEVKPQ